MGKLLKGFEKFINKNQLFTQQDELLVAVSGGIDSMVLVDLLQEAGYSFSLAHCNFQLRGEESTKDETLVSNIAKKHDRPFYVEKFDTIEIAKANKLSIQLTARKLRYDWFDQLMTNNGYSKLLTAHHANDQLETVLYNLTKGTGIAGLRGIPTVTSSLARPLLNTSKSAIKAYAIENTLDWREDHSNLDNKYSRNKIRLNIIPELKKINPSIEKTIESNTYRFASLEKLLLAETQKIRQHYMSNPISVSSIVLDTSWYHEDKGGLAILTELLKGYQFTFDQCQGIGGLIQEIDSLTTGKQFHSTTHSLLFNRNDILITERSEIENHKVHIAMGDREINTQTALFKLEYHSTKVNWTTDKNMAYLDAEKLQFPLEIRNWNHGDTFFPLGMKHKKKVSDFMIDEKIPVNLKAKLPIFTSNNEIIWVAGQRIDNRYKIDSNTQSVLIIRMTENV